MLHFMAEMGRGDIGVESYRKDFGKIYYWFFSEGQVSLYYLSIHFKISNIFLDTEQKWNYEGPMWK